MDHVGALLKDIQQMPELGALDRRASNFLNDVAEIYERNGPGATRAYLLNQRAKRPPEVGLLLRLLDKFETYPEIRLNRAIGRQIIKCLFELKGRTSR